jgi:putative transposase
MRFVYNQLVAKWKAGEKYNRKTFQKFCSDLRKATVWMQEVTSRATYEAADFFYSAVDRFFKKLGNPPSFKKKGKRDGFRFSHSSQFRVIGRHLRIQGLNELIDMREKIRFEGSIKSVSIKPYCGKWYASFFVEIEESPVEHQQREPSVGIDLGLKKLATLSNGESIENPKPLIRVLKKLKRIQREVSRKFVRGRKQSNRYKKSAAKLARVHKKVVDRRMANIHAFTSSVVKRFDRIVIEDLNVSGMQKNGKLARSIADAAWGAIRRTLEYKCKMAKVTLVVADRFFASSKTCSGCGHKREKLSLRERVFDCPCCGLSLDRDLNASINLDRYTSPPIKGRSKTIALGLCKTTRVAGPIEGDNIRSAFTKEGSLSS